MPLLTSRWVFWWRPPTRAQQAWAEGLGGERERALGRGLCEVTEWSPAPPGRQGVWPWRGVAWPGARGCGPGAGRGLARGLAEPGHVGGGPVSRET